MEWKIRICVCVHLCASAAKYKTRICRSLNFFLILQIRPVYRTILKQVSTKTGSREQRTCGQNSHGPDNLNHGLYKYKRR